MDLLTMGRLLLDPDLRTRVQAACLITRTEFTDEVMWKVLAAPDVASNCTSDPPSADNVPDSAIIAVLEKAPPSTPSEGGVN